MIRAPLANLDQLVRIRGTDHQADRSRISGVPGPAPVRHRQEERIAVRQLEVLQVPTARIAGLAEHDDALAFMGQVGGHRILPKVGVDRDRIETEFIEPPMGICFRRRAHVVHLAVQDHRNIVRYGVTHRPEHG